MIGITDKGKQCIRVFWHAAVPKKECVQGKPGEGGVLGFQPRKQLFGLGPIALLR